MMDADCQRSELHCKPGHGWPAAKFFTTLPRGSLNRLRANRQLYAFPDAGRLTKIHTKIAVEENILSGSRSEAGKAIRTSDLDD